MYVKLTKRVEAIIKQARSFAREADQEYLGTEHVLLAIAREGTGVGARVLQAFGVDEYRLRAEIAKLTRKSMEETWVFGRLPGSPHLKASVATAIELAQKMNAQELGTEHLLLAMLSERGSIARQSLEALGVTFDKAVGEIRTLSAKP